MADTSLAGLSDSGFVNECCESLWALYVALLDADTVAATKPYNPDNFRAAYKVIREKIRRVSQFASLRLNGIADKYGITGTGNWLTDFHEDISENKFHEMKTQYVLVVLKRYRAINALRNIIRSDNASGQVPLDQSTVAGPTAGASASSQGPTMSGDRILESGQALLRVFTNGMVDERLTQARSILANDTLTVNEKLTKIDDLIPFPPTASAEQLGEMCGVRKQSVLKTEWWKSKRKGERGDEIGRRMMQHKNRAIVYETPGD